MPYARAYDKCCFFFLFFSREVHTNRFAWTVSRRTRVKLTKRTSHRPYGTPQPSPSSSSPSARTKRDVSETVLLLYIASVVARNNIINISVVENTRDLRAALLQVRNKTTRDDDDASDFLNCFGQKKGCVDDGRPPPPLFGVFAVPLRTACRLRSNNG